MFRSLSLVAILLGVCVSPLHAQVTMVRPDPVNYPTWQVPCDHPIAIQYGFSCHASTSTPAQAPPTDAQCANLNPYVNPDLAARCSARPPAPLAEPTFIVGAVYAYGYQQLQARIIGLTRDADGVLVVTASWLPISGGSGVFAERLPASPGGASNWYFLSVQ